MNFKEVREQLYFNGETASFVLYGISDTDFIPDIKKELEHHAEEIKNYFHFDALPEKIIYCHVGSALIKRYAGNPNSKGRANLDYGGIVSVYKFHPHEITHVIIHAHLGESHPFLTEGVAVLFGWRSADGDAFWKQKPLEFWEEKRVMENKTTTEEIFNHFDSLPQDLAYPHAGYTVKNIVKKQGVEKFKEIYVRCTPKIAYREFKKVARI